MYLIVNTKFLIENTKFLIETTIDLFKLLAIFKSYYFLCIFYNLIIKMSIVMQNFNNYKRINFNLN